MIYGAPELPCSIFHRANLEESPMLPLFQQEKYNYFSILKPKAIHVFEDKCELQAKSAERACVLF